jgi:hypothetical protein
VNGPAASSRARHGGVDGQVVHRVGAAEPQHSRSRVGRRRLHHDGRRTDQGVGAAQVLLDLRQARAPCQRRSVGAERLVAWMPSGLERKTGWSLAEHAGERSPAGCSGCSPPPGPGRRPRRPARLRRRRARRSRWRADRRRHRLREGRLLLGRGAAAVHGHRREDHELPAGGVPDLARTWPCSRAPGCEAAHLHACPVKGTPRLAYAGPVRVLQRASNRLMGGSAIAQLGMRVTQIGLICVLVSCLVSADAADQRMAAGGLAGRVAENPAGGFSGWS